jgi:hypothetical protein
MHIWQLHWRVWSEYSTCGLPCIAQVWHAHILDTAAYEACNEYMMRYAEPGSLGANGRRTRRHFIHHDPMGALDQDARKKRAIRSV